MTMKIYQIAMFVFAFNASLSILNSMNIFGTYIPHNQGLLSYNYSDYNSQIGITDYLAFFTKGFSIFIEAILNSTVLLPFFLSQLGVPPALNVVITAGTWLVYGIGLVQFLSGRYVE